MEQEIQQLKQQRDELLDALKQMIARYGQDQGCRHVEYARIIIREVEAAK